MSVTTAFSGSRTPSNPVPLTQLATEAQSTLVGRAAGAGTGVPSALTAAQVKTLLAIANADVGITTGAIVGGAEIPVMIDKQTLSAASTYTTPTWTAGKYKEIVIKFKGVRGAADLYYCLRANNDSSAVYVDTGTVSNAGVGADSSVYGTLGYARIAQAFAASDNSIQFVANFFPLKDGYHRTGRSFSGTFNAGIINFSQNRHNEFAYLDTTTDITFLTILASAGAITGVIEVLGFLA